LTPINFILQNSKIDGKRLIPELKMPFDVILQANKTQDWLPLVDVFRNYRVEIDIDFIDPKGMFLI